jgi:hypothetical protein
LKVHVLTAENALVVEGPHKLGHRAVRLLLLAGVARGDGFYLHVTVDEHHERRSGN